MMINNFSQDFGPFGNKLWLNCAHQGPLPRVAAGAAEEAIAWKRAPWSLTTERFSGVPQRLKQAIGHLINAPAEEIILGNSASYGLHLLANGIHWRAGDEVILMKDDFPSDILPWLMLAERGVTLRFIEPRNFVPQADELVANITPATKVFCVTLVHSFSGYAVDMQALGEVCRARGVKFVLNASQALGTRVFNVKDTPVDAVVSVGFKWLCGPYGTGFCWLRQELRESLKRTQAYWLSMQTADELSGEQGAPMLRDDLGARAFDVFGTANFFNFKPWTASVEYLLAQGIENVAAHNDRLVSELIAGLDRRRYEILSPLTGPQRSTLVLISHKQAERNPEIYERLRRQDIYVALRRGRLRISPHIHLTNDDIAQALDALNAC
ncbi:MAG TPA: aminotransferase class V-fold PLP-dependent enzyme [Blastocatellia bacterium]|jgi:selenocysteine lyase/cysteine desulfurase|nr:aminotransferase class V-fold PLP-dependent enzyme [Blastocatellia bacterium]